MNPDFKELLLTFNEHGVEYLIVGAHALAAHGHVRATKHLDIWVRPAESNAQKVLQALSDFGAPLKDLTADDLSRKETIFQIGLAPLRVDILTDIDGVEFQEAWPDRLETLFGGVPAFVISRHHLITNKKPPDAFKIWLTCSNWRRPNISHSFPNSRSEVCKSAT